MYKMKRNFDSKEFAISDEKQEIYKCWILLKELVGKLRNLWSRTLLQLLVKGLFEISGKM